MQLSIISIIFIFFFFVQDVKAQFWKKNSKKKFKMVEGDTTSIVGVKTYEKPDWKVIDLDILSSYYEQDGNNAAVTGGIGTERLTDFTQKIIVTVPTSEQMRLKFDAGYDFYTSASTDNIDSNNSSASRLDLRGHVNIGLERDVSDTKTIGFRVGGSAEYDYISINGGMYYNMLSQNQNTGVSLGLQAFFDTWSLIYPSEIRRSSQAATDKRRSFNASLGVTQVINKKMQISLQAEAIYMEGLLSTPFHRVYFAGQNLPRIENLPDTRIKIPIGLRFNYYLSNSLIARTYYRFYTDDWGMTAHTFNLELPIKLNRFLALSPYFRYHTQTAADHFRPYQEHLSTSEFYTSDYDLAELNSQTYGLGLTYSPAGGIKKMKRILTKGKHFTFDSIEFKYGHYRRSTGLSANIFSLGLGFKF